MDDTLRALERSLLAGSGDESTACAYLAAAARSADDALVPPPVSFGGKPVFGPLLPDEKRRLSEIEPALLVEDERAHGWVLAEERGKALYAAVLRLRILEIGRADLKKGFATWFALHEALDVGGAPALERLLGRIREGSPPQIEAISQLLASRKDAEIGVRLVKLAAELPVDGRVRIYDALAFGIVPLAGAGHELLRTAIHRELPTLRQRAYAALRRGADAATFKRDFSSGTPEVRACALEDLVARSERDVASELVRHALCDEEPLVRRAAIRIVGQPDWQHPRTAEWAMGRLTDQDRAVRHEAIRVIRKLNVSQRQLPRLRLIVGSAAPGLKPQLTRLLENIEQRNRRPAR